jgi:hypothetical protein
MEKKQCVICSEDIDQSDYLDHVSSCSIEKNSADNRFNETNSDHHESSIQVYLVEIFIYYLFRNL